MAKGKSRAKPKKKNDYEICPFTILVDSREGLPFQFKNFKCDSDFSNKPLVINTEVATLKTGDYSIKGYEENGICCERKSLPDLYGTLGSGRERFIREFDRMREFDFSIVVIESSLGNSLKKTCYNCAGSGYLIDSPITVKIDSFNIRNPQQYLANEVLRAINHRNVGCRICQACDGEGVLPANPRSLMSPKTIFRTWLSWMQKYPNTHWAWADTRNLAEHIVFRSLQKFWEFRHGKEKKAA